MHGVDISHWNSGFNPKRNDIAFVITKISQGTSYRDPLGRANIDRAEKAGKLIGAYHFATKNSPNAEADYFAAMLREYGILRTALPVLDYEVLNSNNASWVEQFAQAFKKNTGIWPVLYTSASWCKQFSGIESARHMKLWVAGYPLQRESWPQNETCPYNVAPWSAPIIWQFTGSLKLAGHNGKLDGDIAYINAEEWRKIARGETAEPAPAPAPNLEAVARDVIAGKYGNGTSRKIALERAGYDYRAVQEIVNDLLRHKSVDEVAREVIAGKWGNGSNRKKALERAGYDYRAVQDRVNEILR